MQSDAGGVLGEVKRKISDVQHYTKLASALKELRNHRREAHKKTGEPSMYTYIVHIFTTLFYTYTTLSQLTCT